MFYEVKCYVPVRDSSDNLITGGLFKDRKKAFKQAQDMLRIFTEVNIVYVDAYNDEECVDDASFEVYRATINR